MSDYTTFQQAKPQPTSIFEIVDATDPENYWPIGHFLSLEEAEKACRDPQAAYQCDKDRDGCCEIEIHEHQVGWSSFGEFLMRFHFKRIATEPDSEEEWQLITVKTAEEIRKERQQ